VIPDAIWFGRPERPLAGFLHAPSSPATGGVLICPPFGYEETCAYRTLRQLADLLAADGNLVLRFQYEGTGASSGSGLEPDLLERWLSSVQAGIAELRSRGVERPAIVGLRLGAALACAATGGAEDIGPIVLWSPVTSGARYRRELRALSATNVRTATDDGSLNAVGHVVPRELSEAMRNWSPLAALTRHNEVLVIDSLGLDVSATVEEIRSGGARARVIQIAGAVEFLQTDAERAIVPEDVLTAIVRWLRERPTAPPWLPSLSSADDRWRVFDGGSGKVREEFVRIGPTGLHAVITESVGRPARHGVVFLNNGVATADGPARAWVGFARALAAEGGVSCLRLDFSGLGNSPDLKSRRSGRARRDDPTPRTSAREVLDADRFLRERGVDDVTVVGLCSGAQTAVRTVAYTGSVERVVAINAPLTLFADIGVGPRRRIAWRYAAVVADKAPIRQVLQSLSERLWSVLNRLGLFPDPYTYLRRADARGSRVTLVYAADDDGLVDLRARAGGRLGRLVESGGLSMEVIENMDHSLFNVESRTIALDLLRQVCFADDLSVGRDSQSA
jgi:esterase/lipase